MADSTTATSNDRAVRQAIADGARALLSLQGIALTDAELRAVAKTLTRLAPVAAGLEQDQ